MRRLRELEYLGSVLRALGSRIFESCWSLVLADHTAALCVLIGLCSERT